MSLIEKWKQVVVSLNSKGAPLPMVRDPKTQQASVTVTLVVVSGGACMLSIGLMLATSLAKLKSDFVLNPETSAQIHDAFVSSFQFLIASLSAYLGRKMQRDPNGAISLSPDKSDDDQK